MYRCPTCGRAQHPGETCKPDDDVTMLSVGDTVRPVDDLQRRGTVLKISTEPRRHNGFPQFDLPRMVYVEWDKTPSHWEPPELLSKVQ